MDVLYRRNEGHDSVIENNLLGVNGGNDVVLSIRRERNFVVYVWVIGFLLLLHNVGNSNSSVV